MSLWYVDRSRYEKGIEKCGRERYLSFHSGPNGYGMARKKLSMPLIVGIPVHEALATILTGMQGTDALPTEGLIRAAIKVQVDDYKVKVEKFGVEQLAEMDPTYVAHTIQEQTALLTGMVWAWVIETLPYIHEKYRFVSIEREEELVLDCTCGVGDKIGTFDDHEARECQGIGVMSRADAIGELRQSPGSYGLHDFKTTSYFSERWENEWETKLQFAMSVMGAERRFGAEFHEHYIHGLSKGGRYKTKDPETGQKTGPKYQNSPFCYGWRRMGNPPLEPDDWKPTYKWIDDQGKERRCGKGYDRTPVWDFPTPEGYDPVEYWVRMLPDFARREQLKLVGPLNRQRVMIESMGRQIVGEERRWQTVLFELYEASSAIGPGYWTDTSFRELLDKLIPQSWACRRFGKEHRCEFEWICFMEPGWEDPLASRMQLRRPHHDRELQQMRERGLQVPDEWDEDEA